MHQSVVLRECIAVNRYNLILDQSLMCVHACTYVGVGSVGESGGILAFNHRSANDVAHLCAPVC